MVEALARTWGWSRWPRRPAGGAWPGSVTARRREWGERQRATRAVLQVEERNEPAVALYRSVGFTTHHRYVTYRQP